MRVAASTIVLLCVLTGSAQAQFATLPVSKCSAAKLKAVGKTASALLGCHRKDAAHETACLAKVDGKFDAPGRGPFDKADAKNQSCLPGTTDRQSAYRTKLDGFANGIDVLLGVPATPSHCDAKRLLCVAKYVSGTLGCVAKTAGKLGGTVDADCLAKPAAKLTTCWDQATDTCANGTTAATAKAQADQFIGGAACNLLPGSTPCPPVCGNAFVEPGELCDASAAPDVGVCGADFPCAACTCACPTSVELVDDPSAAASVVDRGWTGFGHRAPLPSDGTLTFAVACAATTRPCGTCALSGPLPNADANAGVPQNRRCADDTRVACTTDGDCAGVGGPCAFFAGTIEPVSTGGVAMCVTNHFAGGATGTVDVGGGALATSATVVRRTYAGISVDTPCPTCAGDPIANDGVAGGLCTGGAHAGAPCDATGDVPSRPDFGAVSFDCPPASGALLGDASLAIDYTTDTVTMTRTASSPVCSYPGPAPIGSRCLCDTCNNGNAEPCATNADCPDPPGPTGPICGGRRCIGGANAGTPCTASSECPSGSCNWAGQPTKPSNCLIDDSIAPRLFTVGCVDTEPIDGEGECDYGPLVYTCSVASGHAQRGCVIDDDCGGGAGSCESHPRLCFLTGPFSPYPDGQGTGTLNAVGAADPPVADAFAPTLARVGCAAPVGSGAANAVLGLPGPERETRRTLATFHP